MPVISKNISDCFTIENCGCFSLERTLSCGQCFRWSKISDDLWQGIVNGKSVVVSQTGSSLTFSGITPFDKDCELFWRNYFDMERDYEATDRLLCRDERFRKASAYAAGIHILKQQPWEALCSFIISQNNNIPRISGIISRLCEDFGEPLEGGGYSFPDASVIAGLNAGDLAPLRAGFRVRYILDAATRVANGDIDFEFAKNAPLDDARRHLMTITGVGEKVADCTLLYGCERIEAFPRDVWIKRAMASMFPEGLPEEYYNIGGIAQQYLFHYIRNEKD